MDILSTSGINNLINTYRYSENSKKINPLLERKSKFSNLSKTWNSLSSKLTALKNLTLKLKEVSTSNIFSAKKVELSTEEYFTAIANSSASISSYNISISQLAKNDLVMSDTVSSEQLAGLSAGTYTFQVASGEFDQTLQIDVAGTENLKELMELIADAINDASEGIVSASVFSPKSGESKLSVINSETGSSNSLVIKDVSGSALSTIGLSFETRTLLTDDNTGGYSYSLDQLNSKLQLNGVSIERESNTIDDLINGITLTLKNEMEVGIPTVNVTVKNNIEAVKSSLEDLIAKFNDAYSFVKSNYNSEKDGTRGVFVGNASALGLLQSLSNIAYKKVEGIEDGNFSFLSEIGIEFNTSTGLSIADNDLLEEALTNNPNQVADLIYSENGIANKLYNLADSYVGLSGVISNLTKSYDKSASYLTDKISYMEKQIDNNSNLLRKQYEQLQLQLATLLNSQSYFSSMGGF